MATIYRDYCFGCGCRSEFLEGRCLVCETRLSDTKSEFKERRSTTRKEKVNQIKDGSEGVLYGPLFEQGKDTV